MLVEWTGLKKVNARNKVYDFNTLKYFDFGVCKEQVLSRNAQKFWGNIWKAYSFVISGKIESSQVILIFSLMKTKKSIICNAL